MGKIAGYGKEYGAYWKSKREQEGKKVYEWKTTDNYWGFRSTREKEGVLDFLHVWAGGKGFCGLWYYTKKSY